nr:type I restriction-modification system subunit M N-terminal domain-containing protein [Nostoc sp. MG11]
MLPMTVLRRFDCVLSPTKPQVLAECKKWSEQGLKDKVLDAMLNKVAGQRFHNRSIYCICGNGAISAIY